jgi:hypothetical protein
MKTGEEGDAIPLFQVFKISRPVSGVIHLMDRLKERERSWMEYDD